jgi:hypothetical protein
MILGLHPMTQLDAAANPLTGAFQSEPDPTPYEAVQPAQPLDESNPPGEGAEPRRVQAEPKALQASL